MLERKAIWCCRVWCAIVQLIRQPKRRVQLKLGRFHRQCNQFQRFPPQQQHQKQRLHTNWILLKWKFSSQNGNRQRVSPRQMSAIRSVNLHGFQLKWKPICRSTDRRNLFFVHDSILFYKCFEINCVVDAGHMQEERQMVGGKRCFEVRSLLKMVESERFSSRRKQKRKRKRKRSFPMQIIMHGN